MRNLKQLGAAAGLAGVMMAGGALLLGQPAPSPRTSGEPAASGAGPATTRNGTTRPTQIAMYFKDADVNSVLEHLSRAAGFQIVMDTPIKGLVNILIHQPVTPEEAVSHLNTALKALGYGSVYQELQGERRLLVASLDKIKKMGPVRYGAVASEVPATDDVMTWVIPVKNVDVMRMRQDLAPLFPVGADVAANGASNTLLITDTGTSIRRVITLIAALDSHDPEQNAYQIFDLKYANATATAKLLQSIFPQSGAQTGSQGAPGTFSFDGRSFSPDSSSSRDRSSRDSRSSGVDRALRSRMNVAADDRTNRLVVTAPKETLELVGKVIAELDKDPKKALELRLFKLKSSDATGAAKLINSVFSSPALGGSGQPGGSSSSGGSPSGDYRSYRSRSSGGDSATTGTGLDAAAGRVNAVADDRTNSIVVTAPPAAMETVEKMVKDLEEIVDPEDSFFIYPLRNAQASNLEYILNSLFSGGTSGTGSRTGGTSSSRGGTSGRSSGGSSGFGGSSSGLGGGLGSSSSRGGGTGIGRSRGTTSYGGSSMSGGSQYGAYGSAGAMSQRSQQVGTELAGQVYIVADPDTNALLISVATRFVDPVKQIIAELDRPVPQVLIKVLVAEVTHDDSVDLGVDFSLINRRPSGQGSNLSSAFGNASLTTGLVVSTLEDKLNAQLHVLATSGKLDVLSRPYILASDNQPATITVGNSVPFVTNTRVTDTGQQINTIEYQDVGIILNVTPHINPDGLVIMDVTPEVSQLSDSTVNVGNGVAAPIIRTRSADSRVGVRSGQTIVIGGLMQDQKSSTVFKIPLLGDIPLVGPIFTRTQVTKNKTELLFFITPQVAQQPELLQDATEQEKQGLSITPRAVTPGKFEEHLRAMERGNMPLTRPANPKEPSRAIAIPPRPKPVPNQGVDQSPQGQQPPFIPQQPPPGFNGGQ